MSWNCFELKNLTLVGDRGMLVQTQVNMFKEHPGVGWISALKHDDPRKLTIEGAFQPLLFDAYDLAEIELDSFPGERLVVCFNPLLQKNATAINVVSKCSRIRHRLQC